jgi:hypothetical protein
MPRHQPLLLPAIGDVVLLDCFLDRGLGIRCINPSIPTASVPLIRETAGLEQNKLSELTNKDIVRDDPR